MSVITTVLVLGIIVEALIEYGKLIYNKTINWKQVGALILGILLACLAGTDAFKAVGIVFAVPYVGIVLTGVIFSRGSNYAADFIKLIQSAGVKVTNTDDEDTEGDEGSEEVTEDDNIDNTDTAPEVTTSPDTSADASTGNEGSAS